MKSLLLKAALGLLLIPAFTVAGLAQPNTTAMNETLQTIHNRKSVRAFSSQAISKEQVEVLLRAGMAAPSSRNNQPWLFYVITNRDVLKRLSESLPYAKMVANASLAIVVCGDHTKGVLQPEQALNWALDCSAASQNILLAAESLGLGAVWTGVYPYQDRIRVLKTFLMLPENITPLNLIPVGYPNGDEQPKDKYNPNSIKWVE